MRRVIVALNVHDYDDLGDIALDLERIFVDSDPTVWASAADFITDASQPADVRIPPAPEGGGSRG